MTEATIVGIEKLMMQPPLKHLNLTFWFTVWFIILLFGPYLTVYGIPLRLDHLLFPFLSAVLLGLLWKQGVLNLKSPPFLLCSGFIGLSLIMTQVYVRHEVFEVNPLRFLASLESHLRILMMLLIIPSLSRIGTVDFQKLIRVLSYCGVVLSCFGILQMEVRHIPLFENVCEFSALLFSGSHDRAMSTVEMCLGRRAVSVFYSPGNYALFSIFLVSLMVLTKDAFKSSVLKWASIAVILAGGMLSISKGMLTGMAMLVFFLILKKQWKSILMLMLITGVLMIAVFPSFSPYTVLNYVAYCKPDSVQKIYNRYLGNRFGHAETDDTGSNSALKAFDSVIISLQHKADIHSEKTSQARRQLSDGVDIRTGKKPDRHLQMLISDKEPPVKKINMAGYLKHSIEIIKKHPWLGVGYVSNVSAGDSMVIHLMVRGGIVGSALFMLMLIWIFMAIKTSSLSSAYKFCLILFLVTGIGLPTFIQDRTSDIFWCLGALVLGNSPTVKQKVW